MSFGADWTCSCGWANLDVRTRCRHCGKDNPENPPKPLTEAPADDWRNDPTADERWNAGCDFAMTRLCAYLNVDPASVSWDAATETVEGDVSAVIGNILTVKFGEDWSPAALVHGGEDDIRRRERHRAICDRLDARGGVEGAFDPFRRLLAITDALLPDFMPNDETPLRDVTPGVWPTLGDLRRLLAPSPAPAGMKGAARDVLAERRRQVEGEGWSYEHDDEHDDGSLALAAACYAEGPSGRSRVQTITDDVSGGRGDTPVWAKRKVLVPLAWPRSWCPSWWKPSADRRRDLVRAGALIIAEIERLDRADARKADRS